MFGGDLEQFASFEDAFKQFQADMQKGHWHRQVPELTCSSEIDFSKRRCDRASIDPMSMLCVTSFTFTQYTHDGLLDDFVTGKHPLIDDSTTAKVDLQLWDSYLHKEGSVDGQTKKELRLLQILIGDMHQPLHWLERNGYGKDVTVVFRGEERSLLSFWEEFIPLNMKPEYGKVDYGKIERGAARYGNFDKKFRQWAKEGAQKACKDIYEVVGDSTRVELTEEQFQKWQDSAAQSMERAGKRLATVLYALLEHQKSSEQEAHGRGYVHDHVRVGRSSSTNLLIAIVLVPSLLYGLLWHEKAGYKIKLFSKVKSVLE